MSTRLGVDLGTTWTAAAVATDRGVEPLNLGTHGAAIPSVVAVEGGRVVVGESAERQLLVTPADGAREFKRRLGDETPYLLGGTPFGAEALMGKLLAQVVATATERAGAAPDEVVLTHPATWGGYKLDLLREAGRVAGLDGVTLLGEPQAAALHYVRLGRVSAGDVVAVYDFGGGTFDVAIVRCGADPELLGTPEGLERLGGIDLDHAVFAHVNEVVGGQLAELDGTDPEVARGVVRLRAACTAAKEALSSDNDATIDVLVPGLSTQVRMTRGELEDAVRPRLDDTTAAVERALASAGLTADDLTGVLLVGGSSRIPVVSEHLASRLGRPELVDADPKLVVALGAAGGVGAAAFAMAGAGAGADPAAAGAGAGAAGGGQGAGAASLKAAPERGSSSAPVGAVVAGVAAAGAAAVGAMAATNTGLFSDGDDDGGEAAESPAADADLAALAPDEADLAALQAAAESLDAFDDGGADGAAGLAGGGGVRVVSGGGGGGGGGGGPRFQAPQREPSFDRPAPRPADRPMAPGAPAPMAPMAPEIEATRAELRERLGNLAMPEGADAAEFAELHQDLDGLLDRFQGLPGQSVDDAVAGLRAQFEDRVRDFAQDQRIDALLDQQKAEEDAATAVNTEVDAFKATLRDRLANWQPPAGADPAEAAAMRDRLQAMVDRFTPVPGQTAQEALADLRMEFDDEVGDFAQDLRIDALVTDARADDTTTTTPATGETPTTGDMPGTGDMPATGDKPASGEMPGTGETPASGEMPATGETPATGEMPASGEMPATGETPATGEMPASGEMPGTGETPATGETPTSGDMAGTGETPATGDMPSTGATPASSDAMGTPQGIAIGEYDPNTGLPPSDPTPVSTMPVDEFDVMMEQSGTAPATGEGTPAAAEVPAAAAAPDPAVTMTSQDLVGDDVTGATSVMTAPAPMDTTPPAEPATEAMPRPEVTLPAPAADMGDDITGATAAATAADTSSTAVEPEPAPAAEEPDESGGTLPEPDADDTTADLPDATRPLPAPEPMPESDVPAMEPDAASDFADDDVDLPDLSPAPDPDIELT